MATAIILGGVELVNIAAGWLETVDAAEPARRVWVEAFAIGRYPVTNAEYAPYLAASGAAPPPWWAHPDFDDPAQPVVGVSWDEALAFCAWGAVALGRALTLPTTAQWERAARGGLERARFPWGDAHPGTGRFSRPPRVTAGPANPLGLHALSGVCHEWCLDGDPTRRASRGGAWRHQDPWSPVGHPSSLPPGLRYSDYGFRVVAATTTRPSGA
jgi:formylglycine-generating enzyme required for sulfatase activity